MSQHGVFLAIVLTQQCHELFRCDSVIVDNAGELGDFLSVGFGLLVHVVVHQYAHGAGKPNVGDNLRDNICVHCNTSFR